MLNWVNTVELKISVYWSSKTIISPVTNFLGQCNQTWVKLKMRFLWHEGFSWFHFSLFTFTTIPTRCFIRSSCESNILQNCRLHVSFGIWWVSVYIKYSSENHGSKFRALLNEGSLSSLPLQCLGVSYWFVLSVIWIEKSPDVNLVIRSDDHDGN